MRDQNERDYARMLFTHENKELPEIHRLTGIPEATLYKWKCAEDWNDLRTNYRLNPRFLAKQIEQSIYNLIESRTDPETKKTILQSGDGDAIYKLSKTRNDLIKESNYMGIAFDVFDRFQKLLAREHPKLMTMELQQIIGKFLKDTMASL